MEVDRAKGIITAIVSTDHLVDSKYIKDSAVNQRQYLVLFADMNPTDTSVKLCFAVEDAVEDYTVHEYPATDTERDLIRSMMIDVMKTKFGMTPEEFYKCDDFVARYVDDSELNIGGQT